MDRATVQVYEDKAGEWLARRRPLAGDDARGFAARVTAHGVDGPVADLGCGPGWYTAMLPEPAIAMDAAMSMLGHAGEFAPHALRVRADLQALPFRRAALGAAYVRHSYVHVARTAMPLALADLHRALRPGALAEVSVFGGDQDLAPFDDDDIGGRVFSAWPDQLLRDVVEGAGFVVQEWHRRENDKGEVSFRLELERGRMLPDAVGPGMRLLLCGLNPSLYAADAGVGFARPGNRFWPAALAAGIVSVDRDQWHALQHHGVGMTDVVKRATVGAAELTADDYRTGFARLERLAAWLQPGVVCFVGLAGWRAAVDPHAGVGLQHRRVGGRTAYVMPNPSGLNAHTNVADLADHLRTVAALAS